jgi:hypothetical protein
MIPIGIQKEEGPAKTCWTGGRLVSDTNDNTISLLPIVCFIYSPWSEFG